jgi:ubiquinone/menaquinone biosynthesis C-methylase UbiE
MKTVLDACCGSRMFWFDKNNPDCLFIDKRQEQHELCDGRDLVVSPDMVADFRAMPFVDESFNLVVFDPPHLKQIGDSSWMAKKYGRLVGDWQSDIRAGFSECFRVLRIGGTMIFKWNETQIPVKEILALTERKPLFGNRCGRQSKSHWIVFTKEYPNQISSKP